MQGKPGSDARVFLSGSLRCSIANVLFINHHMLLPICFHVPEPNEEITGNRTTAQRYAVT